MNKIYRVGITGAEHVDAEDALLKIGEVLSIYKLNYGKALSITTGACNGVDAIAAMVAASLMIDVYTIVPGDRSRVTKDWQVYCTSFREMPPNSTYRARNEAIVDNSDVLLAFPTTPEKIDGQYTRSGTWLTIRIAQRDNVPVIITMLNAEKSRREILDARRKEEGKSA